MPSGNRKIKMVVSYDGSDFHGFQKQPESLRTVQSELESALKALTGEETEVFGASRTDTGVHAIGQVVHFTTSATIPAPGIGSALKRHLPRDISVMRSEEAEESFHARFSATGKLYKYIIDRSDAPLPTTRRATVHLDAPLDEIRMIRAASLLTGEHDFSAFRNAGSSQTDPVRTIYSFDFKQIGPFLIFSVHGSGFLYRMVRNLAGTLIEVGRGRIDPEAIPEIIESKDRSLAGPTMPPHGLYLIRVDYSLK